MDKVALFEWVRSRWPERVELDDPEILYRLYQQNEEALSPEDDWHQLALWAFHQAVSAYAAKVASADCLTLSPKYISFEEFDRRMRFNLADECWVVEQAVYESAGHSA